MDPRATTRVRSEDSRLVSSTCNLFYRARTPFRMKLTIVSFFPRPFALALSAILWGAIAVSFWYMFGSQTGELLGFHLQAPATKSVGAAVFWSTQFLWFYLYFGAMVAVFASTWMLLSPHPWSRWSILGSALILFTSYFQVQVSVAVNDWYGPFYDLVQAALSKRSPSLCPNSISSLQPSPRLPLSPYPSA